MMPDNTVFVWTLKDVGLVVALVVALVCFAWSGVSYWWKNRKR